MTVADCLRLYLANMPDQSVAKLDLDWLLSHALGQSRSWLRIYPDYTLNEQQQRSFLDLVERRASGEPVAYILGEWEFFSLTLKVNQYTLVPRPETELLVEEAVARIRCIKQPKILDLGTGSGAIAIAVKHQIPDADVSAIDLSEGALAVAEENAANHGLNIRFLLGSWFEPLTTEKRFDCILCNPPYVAPNDPHLTRGDLRFEPQSALTPGDTALSSIEEVAKMSPRFLSAGGWMMFEHGYDQAKQVQDLMQAFGFHSVQSKQDHQGIERITIGQWG